MHQYIKMTSTNVHHTHECSITIVEQIALEQYYDVS